MAFFGKLVIQCEGGNRAIQISEFLSALDYAYNSVYSYERYLNEYLRYPEKLKGWDLFGFPIPSIRRSDQGRYSRGWPSSPEAVRAMVVSNDRLVLRSAEFHSPGFLEFLGAVNPLEVLRKYLQDVHERRKDRYREPYERKLLESEDRKSELEEKILETEIMRKEVQLLKDLGATEHDLAPLKNVLLRDPLEKLGVFRDRRIIGTSE